MPNTSSHAFDLIVIGGGSAGYTAAAEGVKVGLRTALIEDARELGGLCILRGCMPSKALIASANRLQACLGAAEFGIKLKAQPQLHPRIVLARKRRLVETFAKARRDEIARGGFRLVRGRARFLDDQTVSVTLPEEKLAREFTSKTFVIATGSYIPKPDFPGLAEIGYLTSDDVLEDGNPPRSIIIIGDGPVGLEAAHYYSAIGTKVILLGEHSHILDPADVDVAKALAEALQQSGVEIIYHAKAESAARQSGKKALKLRIKGRARTVVADEILYATGRKPCVENLGLEIVKVEMDENDHIAANEQQRTGRQHIFAAGDVCGPYEILHLAVLQGRVAARNAARHLGRLRSTVESMDYRMKLSAIFTEPEVAVLGLTEKKAREKGTAVRTATYSFAEEGRAQVEGKTAGFAKLLCEPKTGKLLGAAIVGPSAAELIHEMAAVLHFGGTVKSIADIPHYHPTLSEIWTFPAEKLCQQLGL